MDFNETFAPVCSYRSVRMMLVVAAHEGLELRQLTLKKHFFKWLPQGGGVHPPATWVETPGRSWPRVTHGLCPLRFATGVEGLE
jgi:hypothetical protein